MIAVILHLAPGANAQGSSNQILLLDGKEAAARLKDDILSGLSECTIEAWIRWDAFNRFGQPWSFGTTSSCVGLNTISSTSDLQLFAYESNGALHVARAPQTIELHQWYHLAAVISNTEGLQLFLNGVLIAKTPEGISDIDSIAGSGPAWVGRSPWDQNGHFIGAMDELRVWDHARSPEQIHSEMNRQASGSEAGLIGLWNFDPSTQFLRNPVLKSAEFVGGSTLPLLPWGALTSSPTPIVLQGEVKDEIGNGLPNASIVLKSGKNVLNRATSDSSGKYSIVSTQYLPIGSDLELIANHLTRGTHLTLDSDQSLNRGVIHQDLKLEPALHLEGSVFTLNNAPFPYVLVEAIAVENHLDSIEHNRFFSWTDADGNYRFVNLPRQQYRLRAHLPNGWMGLKRTLSEATETVTRTIPYAPEQVSIFDTTQTASYRNLDFHIPDFRKARTTTFDLLSNLNEIEIRCMEFDNFGRLWVGLEKGGLAVSSNGKFEHVPSTDLKPDRILSLHLDGERLWIGTEAGLFWQSGFEINIQQPEAFESLNDEEIWCVYHDKKDRVWIGSNKGLYQFSDQTEQPLIHIEPFRDRWIKDVLTKDDGTIWVATWGNGLFEEIGEGWKQYGLYEGLVHQHVSSLAKRKNGDIWMGTDGGLSIYSPQEGTFRNESSHSVLLDPFITDIVEDKEGVVWLATQGVGLLRYDEGRWSNWEQSLQIPHQWITSCLLDPTGDLWLGTHSGLSLFDYQHLKTFDHHDGLSHSLMLDLDGNDQGELWVGTQGMGVFYYDGSRFTRISKDAGLPHEHISTVAVDDHTGQIWAGGVVGISELSGSTVVETYLDSSGQEGEMTEIRDLAPGADGSLWLASYTSGLAHFSPKDRSVETYGTGEIHALCLSLQETRTIWVGTDQGVFLFNGSELSMPSALEPLAKARIEAIEWEHQQERLWIVSGLGIFQYFPRTTTLRRISPEDNPLLNRGNQICISANNQRCWVGLLGGGMSIFNGAQWSSMDDRDGLPHNAVRTVFEDHHGTIWGGTDAGIFSLIPQHRIPRLNLKLTTELGSKFYQSGMTSTKPFEVLAKRRLTMEYALINMTSSQSKRQFQYRVTSEDNETHQWLSLANNPMTDIHFNTPGQYTLEYRAYDTELNESEVESIHLLVLPEDHYSPWYRTSEFITITSIFLFILLVIVVALLSKYYQHKRRMFQERELHMLEVEQKNTALELAKDEALRALHVKSEFLSTVSHEIRTPMNGMLGMNFLLMKTQLSDEQKDYSETIKHCGEVLLKTINDILDLSKMEAGKLKLHRHRFIFKQTVEDALRVTEGNAKKKGLSLVMEYDTDIPVAFVGDAQRLSQVIINLVGNSIKFTHEGTIIVRVQKIRATESKYLIRIEVEDPGIGIPEDLINALFEPFSQGDSSDSREYGGSGLGLSICKRLVEAMGGEIGYHPAPKCGSLFWLEIELEKTN